MTSYLLMGSSPWLKYVAPTVAILGLLGSFAGWAWSKLESIQVHIATLEERSESQRERIRDLEDRILGPEMAALRSAERKNREANRKR